MHTDATAQLTQYCRATDHQMFRSLEIFLPHYVTLLYWIVFCHSFLFNMLVVLFPVAVIKDNAFVSCKTFYRYIFCYYYVL